MRGVQRNRTMDRKKFRDAVVLAVKGELCLSDRECCSLLGISVKTANRLVNHGLCSVDTFLTVCDWAGFDPMEFFIRKEATCLR